MREQGMKIRDIARISGVNRQALYPLFRYEQAPTLDRLVTLAAGLGRDVSELLLPVSNVRRED